MEMKWISCCQPSPRLNTYGRLQSCGQCSPHAHHNTKEGTCSLIILQDSCTMSQSSFDWTKREKTNTNKTRDTEAQRISLCGVSGRPGDPNSPVDLTSSGRGHQVSSPLLIATKNAIIKKVVPHVHRTKLNRPLKCLGLMLTSPAGDFAAVSLSSASPVQSAALGR